MEQSSAAFRPKFSHLALYSILLKKTCLGRPILEDHASALARVAIRRYIIKVCIFIYLEGKTTFVGLPEGFAFPDRM